MKIRSFKVGDITIGGGPLVLIAGPCVIESEKHALFLAKKISSIAKQAGFRYIFKSSFDKANRTSINSFRGVGIEKGLGILSKVKNQAGVPVLSDIHEVWQAGFVKDVLDVIQIPAFLSRQTDLLVAAGKTKKAVNIKKGQFLAPWDVKNAVEKVYETGNRKVMVTERGFSFGYNNLVVDMRSLVTMRQQGFPVVYDATHSLQLPGGQGTATGGLREYIPYLAKAATATGIDVLFLEVHDKPEKAQSDASTQFPLSRLSQLLKTIKKIDLIAKNDR